MNDADLIWTDPADSPASSYMPDTDALDSLAAQDLAEARSGDGLEVCGEGE